MKKYLIALLFVFGLGTTVWAQETFVIKAGLNFNKLEDIQIGELKKSWEMQTGFHAGLGGQFRFPRIGLSVQPELLYSRMRTDMVGVLSQNSYELRIDYIDVPLNVQWGINILFLRPYVFAAPYVRYALAKGKMLENVSWDNLNRFDYGLGIGAGLEIWKLQISGKYNWSFVKLAKDGSVHIDRGDWKLGDSNMKGFELSVAILF